MKPGGIQTFLIADIRGYTRFTQAEGDEAAGRLAEKFASLTRESVKAYGGRLLELRGDEALVVFDSTRLALKAAVDLQARFLEATEAEPELPLGVGIGIDAGEAVAVEEGYRGGALNLAARLCSLAGPGEILASAEVTHLAQRIPGISYQSKGRQQLKGLAPGTEAVKVFAEDGDPALRFAALTSKAVEQGRRRKRLVGWVAGAAVVVVALALFFMSMRAPVQGRGLEADSVGLIDLDTGEVIAPIEVGDRPGGVAVGDGSVWVTNSGSNNVSRIDPDTSAVIDTVPVGTEPSGIAFGYGQLWVANGPDATVSRIDPETNTEVQTIDVDSGPTGVAAGLGSIWVTNKLDDTVTRLEPDTGKFEKTIDVGDGPTEIAVGYGAVWVTNQHASTVSRIDPDTNSATDPVNVGNGPLGITTGGGAVWVANSLDDTVSRIDPETQSEADKVPVGSGPSDVIWSDGALWVTNETEGTLSKIDASSTEVVDRVDIGASPAGSAVTAEGLWVAVRDDGDSHRGGTLTILDNFALDSIDPGVAYLPVSWEILNVTNDGLVGFKRAGGIEGATLVPNLATSLPTPTNGGRTYTFQLRPDIRYSTGARVKASDIRRSIERTVKFQSAPGYFYGMIRGASACSSRHCDLSEGIVADGATGTVTFHLEVPDPDFLYKLATPFASVLPAQTPEAIGERSVPATGPYMIAKHEPGRQLEMVRNPHFREWSPAAQPRGYAEEIVYQFDVESRERLSQVISGRADLTYPDVDQLEEVTTRYPEQTMVTVETGVQFMALNTRIPPFNDFRVRRAMNYAIDRERIVDIFGGPNQARSTCQVLPPTFPSYQPYCPFTSGPAAKGEWRGQDLERARELIAASGTKGMKVTVWVGDFRPLGDYFVSLLTDLGYVANLKNLDAFDERYEKTVGNSRTRAQIIYSGWFADYPAPSTFVEPLLTCDSYVPRNGGANTNWAGFCDASIDSLVAEARRLSVSDPASARGLWTKIDAAIVDRAPWVPLANPRTIRFLSERVGNFQYQQTAGVVLEQLWVR